MCTRYINSVSSSEGSAGAAAVFSEAFFRLAVNVLHLTGRYQLSVPLPSRGREHCSTLPFNQCVIWITIIRLASRTKTNRQRRSGTEGCGNYEYNFFLNSAQSKKKT